MIKSETQIIEICYAALKAYRNNHQVIGCIGLDRPQNGRESALGDAVRLVLNRPATTPRGMHENWIVSPYKGVLLFPEEVIVPWNALTEPQKTEYVMLCNLINSFRGYAVEPIQITVRQAENFLVGPRSRYAPSPEKLTTQVSYETLYQDGQDAKDQATLTRLEAVMFVVLGIVLTLGAIGLFP